MATRKTAVKSLKVKKTNQMPTGMPAGMHRMPNGMLMNDSEMPMYGKQKITNKGSKKKGK